MNPWGEKKPKTFKLKEKKNQTTANFKKLLHTAAASGEAEQYIYTKAVFMQGTCISRLPLESSRRKGALPHRKNKSDDAPHLQRAQLSSQTKKEAN